MEANRYVAFESKNLADSSRTPSLKTFCSCAETSDGNFIVYVETIWEKHSLQILMIGNFCLYLVDITCLWIKNCNFATITDV